MKPKILFAALVGMLAVYTAWGQTAEPTVTFHDKANDADVEMSPGENQTMNAPLEIKLTANVKADSYWSYKCEWKIYNMKDGESKPLVDRFDETTSFTLTSSGAYGVKLYITFTDGDGEEVEYESEAFTISITESKLSCPDGFSPNDDKINDVFEVEYQSIVKMKGVIFNRWGQKVYEFDLSNVDQGWDGRQNGRYVKDGVYFLNLQAVGSDGIKYDIKKAINIMKGLRDYDE
ncbi:MAG: gliding motility-associated C-terminal domain-containing protein [Bacteroidaceae bacterium]|nr:gliding motility-associated C-terminal domain-containing protein [Bacteroidaceae bacterium]